MLSPSLGRNLKITIFSYFKYIIIIFYLRSNFDFDVLICIICQEQFNNYFEMKNLFNFKTKRDQNNIITALNLHSSINQGKVGLEFLLD
jgi:hypothetical protein